MHILGFWYDNGQKGLVKDQKEAFKWFQRSADLDDPTGLAECGGCYLYGDGVEVNRVRGMMLVTQAAGLGSEYACWLLGEFHKEGDHGLPKDTAQAAKWFRKMPDCTVKDASEQHRQATRQEALEFVRNNI
eukprot:7211367-Prymnesium_polylepis.1